MMTENMETSKLNQISNLLSSFISEVPNLNKVNDQSNENSRKHEFQDRVKSFDVGKWSIFNISPLLCAQYGWKFFEEDILKCETCETFLCTSLPPISNHAAYTNTIKKLKNEIRNHHKRWCRWIDHPSPDHFCMPLKNMTMHDIVELRNNVSSLISLGTKLPSIKTKEVLGLLDLELSQLEVLIKSKKPITSVEEDAVLLTLCGWTYDSNSYIKCTICMRIVGLWNFYNNEENDSSTAINDKQLEIEEANASVSCQNNDQCADLTSSCDESEPPRKRLCKSSRSYSDFTEKGKTLFNPLAEHRSWCGWVTNVTLGNKELKGYHIMPPQIKKLSSDFVYSKENEIGLPGLQALRSFLNNSYFESI